MVRRWCRLSSKPNAPPSQPHPQRLTTVLTCSTGNRTLCPCAIIPLKLSQSLYVIHHVQVRVDGDKCELSIGHLVVIIVITIIGIERNTPINVIIIAAVIVNAVSTATSSFFHGQRHQGFLVTWWVDSRIFGIAVMHHDARSTHFAADVHLLAVVALLRCTVLLFRWWGRLKVPQNHGTSFPIFLD